MNGNAQTSLQGANSAPLEPLTGHARYQRVKKALPLIGCGRSKLYRLIRDGRIRAVKLDGATFIDLASVAALFERCPEIAPVKPVGTEVMSAEELGLTPSDDLPALSITEADLRAEFEK